VFDVHRFVLSIKLAALTPAAALLALRSLEGEAGTLETSMYNPPYLKIY
jgi:hypothetical protein